MMKRERQRLLVAICLLALLPNSFYALAQEKKDAPGALKTPANGTFKYFGSKYFSKLVKGAPYSATAITEHIQRLGDGNQIIRKNEAKVYRDGEGRTRIEQKLATIGKWTAADDAPQMTYISDPVSGDDYHLDARTRTARKSVNTRAAALKRELEEERRRKERQEQLKRRDEELKEREKERQEQVRERQAQHKERERKRQEQLKAFEKERQEQLRERQKESKERQLQVKERQKEREVELREREKERQAELKEREKEQQMQQKEREKERQEQLKERQEQSKEREKARQEQLKEREKERQEQLKEREKERQMRVKEELLRKESSSPDGRKKVEPLGKKMIEGVEAEGRRSIVTIPTGEIGNTLPIEIVDENWYAPDLQILVMTRHSDPRSGETTYRLTNIKRNEPDRSLFGVPTDYTIVDESSFKKRAVKVEPMKKPEHMKIEKPKKPESAKTPTSPRKPEAAKKVEPLRKIEPARTSLVRI
jgi:hypothetical protein